MEPRDVVSDTLEASVTCAKSDERMYGVESEKNSQIAAALRTLQELGGMNVARYDFKTSTLYSNSDIVAQFGYGDVITNVPDEFVKKGFIEDSSVDEYYDFFEKLRGGISGTVTVACRVMPSAFHWMRMDARVIYDEDKNPCQAILSLKDIEEERERAAVYKKWRQSFEDNDPESYTLFRCNLSKGASFDKVEGALLKTQFSPAMLTFNERTREYASRFVHIDDYEAYQSLLNSENLLAGYYRGVRAAEMDYRERVSEGEYRWLHLSVEITQYPDSSDVEVFLMYELSDEAKMNDPAIKARIDEDPLTGVLNRRAFEERFDDLAALSRPGLKHAIILTDIDGFKRINENFGHAVGDQALIDIAKALKSVTRRDDFVGRLGGDEFLVCLKNISSQSAVEQLAARILAALRKAYGVDIRLTASLGIALYPNDGKSFSTLYHNVDRALYTAKSNGKDSYAFYGGEATSSASGESGAKEKTRKRRMLLINDDRETIERIKKAFGGQYAIDVCCDEGSVISRIRRYGITLSVVLLGTNVQAADAFRLTDKIRGIGGRNSVSIIALGERGDYETCLELVRRGANDFVLDPIDTGLLSIRIDSAAAKAENERLRAQNTYLQMQNSDASKFRAVYENTDTVVVEFDWGSHSFVYDPSISEHIYGRYDDRSLWQIFMSDMVADVRDVKAMQELVMDLANSSARTSQAFDVMLKTPSKARHWFTMNAFKRVNDMNMPSKIILTFIDVNDDIIAGKKLRFQAEHDSLTELYNRDSFLKLVQETVRGKPESSYILLCCDINDFRFVNERFGRAQGDKLLKYCAEKFLMYANSMNTFAGRLSGDIFALLLPNSQTIAASATKAIRGFFDGYPLKAKITGRAGAYIISDPAITPDAMLDMAYTAKDSIRGKFASWLAVYDDSMNEKRLREKSITDRMEQALLGGQFDVYIQPQFDHATGLIVGAEALVRWIDPQRGVISPGEFIPIFEKNGFITRMDEYVWEKAAQYMSEWILKGNKTVPLSVNVSRENLMDSGLCGKLLAIVDKYDIPVPLFRLEITESLFAEDAKHMARVVEQLHDAGFLIEMDDFGSGYSSLNILKDVPVDILKLDMKFFSGDDSLGRGGMIINAVLRMSRWLGIPVIAEGVEVRDQADFLLSVGCPTIQGYLYKKPMPAAEFEKMLSSDARGIRVQQNDIDSKLENREFWNPLSVDSQLFNNFIGPAAIFEYHDGGYELVRMNKRFIDLMGINESDMLPAGELISMSEEDKPRFKKAVLEVINSYGEVSVDINRVSKSARPLPYHATLRAMAKSADRALILVMLEATHP